ncbi:MAG: PilZ domain-containing protein [bacterium]|nr:PilZ domain-containing protein [bacterium]MCP5065219.1 PilZ domain-containing protein [bacterium]
MPDLTPDQDLDPPRHLVLVYARPHAFVPLTRTILSRLGYALLDPEDWRESSYWAEREPELLVVDEPRLAEVRAIDSQTHAPILMLTGRRGASPGGPRLLGAVHKPAGLHELYRLLEQALEDTPRISPRVSIDLPAQLKRDGREWPGELLSLSESGCLLRSTEPLPLGSAFELSFELPDGGRINTRAASTYQLLPDTGLVFEATPAAGRQAIVQFVEHALLLA